MDDDLFRAAGELEATYWQVDWSATPVGPAASWGPALRRAVRTALSTRFPVSLFWGAEFVAIYNEAFVALIGEKHPSALGAPAAGVFPEAWDSIGPLMRGVLTGKGATWIENAPIPLKRAGAVQEAYFTFSYSPVQNDAGTIEGVMDIAIETTRQVIDRRRITLLGSLREAISDLDEAKELAPRVLPILRAHPDDLPAVDIRSISSDSNKNALPVSRIGELHSTPTGRELALALGSTARDDRRSVLVVGLSDRLLEDTAYLPFLRLIASTLGQTLDRIEGQATERRVAATERMMSESLQRALLPEPLQPDHLQVAVRYLPAAEQAEIGGDWYDAFMAADGALTIVVGDVTGHDRRAAAAMGQVRNVLRGVAYTLIAPPASVLAGLDEAMHGLAVDVFATAILARVEQDPADAARGLRTLRWSNAGHPPPVLISPQGHARLLVTSPDVLLGLGSPDPGDRGDHRITLDPGAIVVFYTDGLIERRGATLDQGFDWLTGLLQDRHTLNAEQVADLIVSELTDPTEDDVALLILRVYEETKPRPAEAGPSIEPAELRSLDSSSSVDES
jgi:serine phosphatase RsbU (regulator of sigma subunit)